MELQFFVVAWRVENMAPAVYRYEADRHCLSFIRPAPDSQTQGKEMVLQTEFASAPLVVLITGNLAAATAIQGTQGYRQLLLRAGSAGQRMWLASVAMGLGGTVFAGFLPRAAHNLAGIDGYRLAGLLAYATGHPVISSAVSDEGRYER
jgi:SagB-type dehydrogenase family enzyme